jgi:Fasciclin domain
MKKIRFNLLLAVAGAVFFTSCNKELEQMAPIATPVYPTGNGVAATIAANPNDSLFNRLLVRSGLSATLNDLSKSFTIFAVDNAGMRLFATAASGGAVPPGAPDAVVSAFIANSLPANSAAGIVQYNTIGQKFPSAALGAAFPNYPLTSQIILDPTQPFVRMNIFPVRGTNSYVNNIPVTGVDQAAANGIIHHTYTIVAPPSATLKTMIAADTSLTYFAAAVSRADSGSTGLSKIDSLLNYGVTNMTVLAPNNTAFRTLVYGLVYSQVFALTGSAAIANAQANGAVAAGPAFLATNNVTTFQIKGIVAYHILASLTSSTTTPYQPNIRVFSANIPATPTFVKTLVNGSVAAHPGVSVKATYTGPFATAATFTGLGTFPPGGAPYSGTAANAVTLDRHAVNGVFHIIDRVLLPQ